MKSREFCSVGDGARWNTNVLRVFLFSHVQDALPRASPLFMWTTLHLPRFIIPTVRSRRSQALSQHYEDSMTVLSPESSFRRALQMIFNFPSMIYKHALFQGWLVSTYWRLPVFYLLSSRCSYRWPPRLTFWSSIINTFASIVSAHLSCLHVVISIRYVDS